MNLAEKIKKIREDNNLTQTEFANRIFVTRTAVSKWELGKGYPSLDSLKLISKEFNVSIDNLTTNDEILKLAEHDIKTQSKSTFKVVFGVLDLVLILFLFLPVFSEKDGDKILPRALISLVNTSTLNLIIFYCIIALNVVCGTMVLIGLKFSDYKYEKWVCIVSLAVSVISLAGFIITRQSYAGILMLALLSIKIILSVKTKCF